MGKKPLMKMPPAQRAKQFMPFDALSGFSDELRKREKIKCERKILSEERIRELNDSILSLEKGEKAAAVYFNGDEYIQIEGIVYKINMILHFLVIDGIEIDFESLTDVAKI